MLDFLLHMPGCAVVKVILVQVDEIPFVLVDAQISGFVDIRLHKMNT